MARYSVSRSFRWRGQMTGKVVQVCRMFGLTVDRLTERESSYSCEVEINDGDIIYITGPSGAGKSVLLKELEEAVAESERVNLAEIELSMDKTLIDCIEGDFLTGLKMLSAAGLNDVFCVLNQPGNLSDGEKYRFRLAMALAAGKRFVFADEFCSNLDRVTAAVISYRLQKYAKRAGVTFILASSHDDILADLSPDVLVIKELAGPAEVIYKERKKCAAGVLVGQG